MKAVRRGAHPTRWRTGCSSTAASAAAIPPYWTRSQSSSDARHARCIKSKGELGRINVITLDEGMRPACYLSLSASEISGGTGTLDDPYTFTLIPPTVMED